MSEHVCISPAICEICADDPRIVPLRDKFAVKIMDWVARQIVVADDTVIIGYGSLADDLMSLIEDDRRGHEARHTAAAAEVAELQGLASSAVQRARIAEGKADAYQKSLHQVLDTINAIKPVVTLMNELKDESQVAELLGVAPWTYIDYLINGKDLPKTQQGPEYEVTSMGTYQAVQFSGMADTPKILSFLGTERVLSARPLTPEGDIVELLIRNGSVVHGEVDETLRIGQGQWVVSCPLVDGRLLFSVMGETAFQTLRQNCAKEQT